MSTFDQVLNDGSYRRNNKPTACCKKHREAATLHHVVRCCYSDSFSIITLLEFELDNWERQPPILIASHRWTSVHPLRKHHISNERQRIIIREKKHSEASATTFPDGCRPGDVLRPRLYAFNSARSSETNKRRTPPWRRTGQIESSDLYDELRRLKVYRNSTLIIHFLLIDVSNFETDDGNIVEYD